MSRFTGIPAVPEGVGSEWQTALLEAIKENIELLTAQRGERDRSSQAVTKGDITIRNLEPPVFDAVSASGEGFFITLPDEPTIEVASLEDYRKLVDDVRLLTEEVLRLRLVVDALIGQIRR